MEMVGWLMSERLKSPLCEDALNMAIRNRRPPKGLIHHSDRGVQYACGDYRKLLRLHGITASMSRKSNCLDATPIGPLLETCIETCIENWERTMAINLRAPFLMAQGLAPQMIAQ